MDKNENQWAELCEPEWMTKCERLEEAISRDDGLAVESLILEGVFFMRPVNTFRASSVATTCAHGLPKAAWSGKVEAVSAFMRTRAAWGPFCRDSDGKPVSERQMIGTALAHCLAIDKNFEIAEMLREGGQEKVGRWSMAANSGAGATPELLDWMLGAGLDVGEKSYGGRTALMWAAETGSPEVVEKLLAISNPREVDDDGKTALMWACDNWPSFDPGALPQLNMMWRERADEGKRILEMLLPVSDARAVNSDGETALMLAVKTGAMDMVEMLAAHVDANARNKEGRSALTLALMERREDIASMLMSVMKMTDKQWRAEAGAAKKAGMPAFQAQILGQLAAGVVARELACECPPKKEAASKARPKKRL